MILICKLCRWQWKTTLKNDVPLRCPHCHSKDWQPGKWFWLTKYFTKPIEPVKRSKKVLPPTRDMFADYEIITKDTSIYDAQDVSNEIKYQTHDEDKEN